LELIEFSRLLGAGIYGFNLVLSKFSSISFAAVIIFGCEEICQILNVFLSKEMKVDLKMTVILYLF
jgi:hypothetical protein